jgi:hypothetical protein
MARARIEQATPRFLGCRSGAVRRRKQRDNVVDTGAVLGRHLQMPVDAGALRSVRASGVQNGGVPAVRATVQSEGGV